MNRLYQVKDSLFNLFSPAAKRRRTLGPQTPAHDLLKDENPFPNFSEPRNAKSGWAVRSTHESYVLSANTISASTNTRKRPREDDDEDPFASGGEDEVLPNDSVSHKPIKSQGSAAESEDEGMSYEVDGDAENVEGDSQLDRSQITTEQKVQEYLEQQQERIATANAEVAELRIRGDWAEEEIRLFARLRMRGLEPVLPVVWNRDFPTLPGDAFHRKGDDAFISETCGTEIRAIRALQQLAKVSIRVDTRVKEGLPTELIMKREIQHYIEWSEYDGEYKKKRFIPVTVIVAARRKQTVDQVMKVLIDQLNFLAEKHRAALALPSPGHINEVGEVELYSRTPPVIYGFLIAGSKVIFVTLNSANPEATMKHISMVDLSQPRMAFWDAISIATVVITARNYMMSIRDELEDDEPEQTDDENGGLGRVDPVWLAKVQKRQRLIEERARRRKEAEAAAAATAAAEEEGNDEGVEVDGEEVQYGSHEEEVEENEESSEEEEQEVIVVGEDGEGEELEEGVETEGEEVDVEVEEDEGSEVEGSEEVEIDEDEDEDEDEEVEDHEMADFETPAYSNEDSE